MRLKAVVTRSSERKRELIENHPDVGVVNSLNELCDRADEFDLAVIATPTGDHFAHALQVLKSGIHVLIDKPITGNAADAAILRQEAMRRSVQVHVFHNRRWDSDFLSLRHATESGKIGAPLVLESRMESLRPIHSRSWRNSTYPQDSGGALLDLGVHLVDQAMQVMGPVTSVYGRTHSVRRGAGANDFFTISLVHERELTSVLVGSKASPLTGARFKMLGTKAVARVGWSDSQELALREGEDPSSATWGEETPAAAVQICSTGAAGETLESLVPAKRGEWNIFYSRLLEAITNNQPPPILLEDVIETMRVLDAARTSADEGRSIELLPPAQHESSSITQLDPI